MHHAPGHQPQAANQTDQPRTGRFLPELHARCVQGAELRRTVPGALVITWRGCGPGGRFDRDRNGAVESEARRRLEAVGLLDEVPTIDSGPGWRDGEGEDPFAEAAALTPDDRGTAHQG